MPDFTASPLVDALEENLFSLLEKLAAEVNTEALPLIDLSSGSPDQPTPPEVIDSLQSAIHRRENHGYPSFWGKPQVREAIARFYRRQYDVELDPHSEVAVFQGSHIGIGGIPRALLSPGQYLISTDPCYPIYRSAALQSQAAFYGLPLRAENHFLPDFNDLPREVADKAGLVVLNYPHNPTGALATPALFASALQFARRHQVPILHDFAYAAIGSAASDAPLSLFSQPDAKAWGVETYTFSKTFNMAGWRFGFAVGNASIIRAFKKLHTHSYSTVFGAIQDAAIAALNLPAERIAQLTAVYHQRREWVLRRLAALRWPARDAQGFLPLARRTARLPFAGVCPSAAAGSAYSGGAGHGFWRRGGRIYSHQPDRRGRGAEQRAGPSCPAGAVLVRRREKQKRNPGRRGLPG